MAKCPGQDIQFWKLDDIYEVDCPKCGSKVEFWKDDVYRRCRKCSHRFRNPKLNLGCAEWCQYAKYCIGQDIKEIEKTAPCATEQGDTTKATLARKESVTMEKTSVQTLDLRPLPPFERHTKIFDTWSSLNAGQALEIINDHDPKPLHYQFQAEYPNSFEWAYKQQGPKDWVVQIKKVVSGSTGQPIAQSGDQKARIKEVLKNLQSAPDDPVLKAQAKQVLRQVGPTELAVLEQELIKEGISRDEIMGLCDVHLEVMAESLKANQITPEAGHPIHTMMSEHKVILGYLDELKSLIAKFSKNGSLNGLSQELERLKYLAHHLSEAEKHHQREEEVIFPALERYGITEPPQIMRLEHTELRQRKKALHQVADNAGNYKYADFIKELEDAGQYLVEELAKHIFKEDNIIYQAALRTFKPEEWKEIKKKCDEIGYCCFTPKH